MKRLLFLLLLLPVIGYSQSPFRKLDSLQFIKVVNMLISETGINYKQETDRQDYDLNNLKFINAEDKNDIIFIEYSSGTYWSLNYIYADYKRIFPIWKKYADPTAESETLKSKGSMILKNNSITKVEKNVWRMRL